MLTTLFCLTITKLCYIFKVANKKKKLGLDKIVCCFIYVYPRFRYFANFVLFRSRSFSRAAEGVPISLFFKIRFEAKLSKTETVLLCFDSVSQNHKKKFHFFSLKKRFITEVLLSKNVLLWLFRYTKVSLRKSSYEC